MRELHGHVGLNSDDMTTRDEKTQLHRYAVHRQLTDFISSALLIMEIHIVLSGLQISIFEKRIIGTDVERN